MNIINNRHEYFMKIALNEAKAAFDEDEIPRSLDFYYSKPFFLSDDFSFNP